MDQRDVEGHRKQRTVTGNALPGWGTIMPQIALPCL
jgi:hypothetical protein